MRFLAILAVLFGVTAGAVALSDPDARPVPQELKRIPLSQMSDRVVFEVLEDGSKPSDIQGLPVPSSAVRAHGADGCAGSERCEEEHWTLRTVDHDALRDWYTDRVDGDAPWRAMAPCGETSAPAHFRWSDGTRRLELQVTGPTIIIRELAAAACG